MGNSPTHTKRQHRPSESVGFNKYDSDGERFVTIQQRERRISTKSAPPLDEIDAVISPVHSTLKTISTSILPCDTYATVTGTFTDWIEHKMTKIDGKFELRIRITQGCHYYKILVNGRQRFIPNKMIENHAKFGHVYFMYVHVNNDNPDYYLDRTILSLHKLNIYTQEANHQLIKDNQLPPPRIPPHLLNIILNQKLPDHYDPDVLPEPNTVMLRHLYALSIQNGIMILSTTVRYKQKFVTTCYYKLN